MTYKVYGHRFESGELSNTSMYQDFKPNKTILLRGVRTGFIFDNNPTITNIQLKLYSNKETATNNEPASLIASSNTLTKANLITDNNGVKHAGFTFNDVGLDADTIYHIVVNGSGYVYTYNSHIAWKLAWPDPIYKTNWIPSIENIGLAPYDLELIGHEL